MPTPIFDCKDLGNGELATVSNLQGKKFIIKSGTAKTGISNKISQITTLK